MRYRVTFRKRFTREGAEADDPTARLSLAEGVVQDVAFVERTEPSSLHVEERMEEDDDFLSFGTEVWDYDVADGREEEFLHATTNSEGVMEHEELADEDMIAGASE